jgi:lipid-A-disaccharide synthase
MALRIMIVAGEASGDKHGASLVNALKNLSAQPELQVFGCGGDEMRAAGVDTIVDIRALAFIGIVEVGGAIGKFYSAYRRLLSAARSRRPDVVVLIDWPDFNMTLARKLHREAFKIVYYISPQVWAWRTHRVRALRRDVDRMLVILPFEEQFYRDAGVEVEYVGHPLAESVRAAATRAEFAASHRLDPSRPIVAMLPGSRRNEIRYHLPAMIDAAKRLRSADCGLPIDDAVSDNPQSSILDPQSSIPNPQSPVRNSQFVVPLASTVDKGQVEDIMRAAGEAAESLIVIERDTYNALAHAEIAVVASGTATVEAALLGTPMVIVYRASEINWRIVRPLIHLDTFGMVNLIAGRKIVPELMQHEMTGERIAAELQSLMGDEQRLERMRRDLAEVRAKLQAGGGAAAERAAQAVMNTAARAGS